MSKPFWIPCETPKRGPTPSNPVERRPTRLHSPPLERSNALIRFPQQPQVLGTQG